MELYDTDYVLVDTNSNKPIEGFDIVYSSEEVGWFLCVGIYTEEEINKILIKLK